MGNSRSKNHENFVTQDSLGKNDPKTKYKVVNDSINTYYHTGYKSNYSKNLTYLMKLILLTNKYPEYNDNIRTYITDNKNEVNKSTKNAWTPLKLAVANCGKNGFSSLETVNILLENGADPNFCGKVRYGYGLTPLDTAAYYSGTTGCFEAVKLLYELSKNIRAGNVLMYATYGKKTNIDTINYFLEKGYTGWEKTTINKITIAQNAYICSKLNKLVNNQPIHNNQPVNNYPIIINNDEDQDEDQDED